MLKQFHWKRTIESKFDVAILAILSSTRKAIYTCLPNGLAKNSRTFDFMNENANCVFSISQEYWIVSEEEAKWTRHRMLLMEK